MNQEITEKTNSGYMLALREIVCQLNTNKISSGGTLTTISKLEFDNFPKKLKALGSLSNVNTRCKVNINYVTKYISQNHHLIDERLFNALKNSVIIEDEYKYTLLSFKSFEDKKVFNLFNKMKGVNSDIYDNQKNGLKYFFLKFEKDKDFTREPYDKTYDDLGPNSKILISKNQEIISSNRILIEIDDFFDLKNDLTLLTTNDIKKNIYFKLKKNRLYNYLVKNNYNINSRIDEIIIHWIEKFNKIIKEIEY